MPVVLDVIEVLAERPKSKVYRVRMRDTLDGVELPTKAQTTIDVFVPDSLCSLEGNVLKVRTWFWQKALRNLELVNGPFERRFSKPYVEPKIEEDVEVVL